MTVSILLRQNVVIKYVKIVLVVYQKKIFKHVQFVEEMNGIILKQKKYLSGYYKIELILTFDIFYFYIFLIIKK